MTDEKLLRRHKKDSRRTSRIEKLLAKLDLTNKRGRLSVAEVDQILADNAKVLKSVALRLEAIRRAN